MGISIPRLKGNWDGRSVCMDVLASDDALYMCIIYHTYDIRQHTRYITFSKSTKISS